MPDREFLIRPYKDSDLPVLSEIIVEAFDGVSIDQGIEKTIGQVAQHDWKWRKARHLEDDVARDREGVFVAEIDGAPVGFITTWQDADAGMGHIPNIAIHRDHRGQGIGRALIEHALEHFRACGLPAARIETLEQNARGDHLYRSFGFREVARQIHYVADLRERG